MGRLIGRLILDTADDLVGGFFVCLILEVNDCEVTAALTARYS